MRAYFRHVLAIAACSAFAMATPQSALADNDTNWRSANIRLFTGKNHDLAHLAQRAYVWGMPLVEAALIRERFTEASAGLPAGQINRFSHRRVLAGPEMHAGVAPNNDTIYSLAWIDLNDGPLVLLAPDFGSRYYTFSINQADSSANQSLGQRTHGGQLPPLFIHSAGDRLAVPKGMVDVPVATRYANLAGRILGRGPDEYPVVNALQDRIRLIRWQDYRAGRMVDAPPPSQPARPVSPADSTLTANERFLVQLGHVVQDWRIRPTERARIQELANLGITLADGFDRRRLSDAQWANVNRGLDLGRALVEQRSLTLGQQDHGWSINYRGPRFGTDHLLRAGVAKDAIYVAIPEEALYPVGRVDAQGHSLDGHARYRIHFPSGALPPVDAFWSITAYDDTGFMVSNAINRYSVGDRTPGLVHDADGGLTLHLSADAPSTGELANWLPVPKGKFYLMMRLYRPRPAVLKRAWQPPAIESQPASGRCQSNCTGWR